VRLERDPGALLDEERFEDVVDPAGASEAPLDLGPPPARPHDGEVAGAGVAEALVVEHERHAGGEVRLADDELAAPADLDDEKVGQTRRKRRRVRPDPQAPSTMPMPSRITAVSGNAQACTSGASAKPW